MGGVLFGDRVAITLDIEAIRPVHGKPEAGRMVKGTNFGERADLEFEMAAARQPASKIA